MMGPTPSGEPYVSGVILQSSKQHCVTCVCVKGAAPGSYGSNGQAPCTAPLPRRQRMLLITCHIGPSCCCYHSGVLLVTLIHAYFIACSLASRLGAPFRGGLTTQPASVPGTVGGPCRTSPAPVLLPGFHALFEQYVTHAGARWLRSMMQLPGAMMACLRDHHRSHGPQRHPLRPPTHPSSREDRSDPPHLESFADFWALPPRPPLNWQLFCSGGTHSRAQAGRAPTAETLTPAWHMSRLKQCHRWVAVWPHHCTSSVQHR